MFTLKLLCFSLSSGILLLIHPVFSSISKRPLGSWSTPGPSSMYITSPVKILSDLICGSGHGTRYSRMVNSLYLLRECEDMFHVLLDIYCVCVCVCYTQGLANSFILLYCIYYFNFVLCDIFVVVLNKNIWRIKYNLCRWIVIFIKRHYLFK